MRLYEKLCTLQGRPQINTGRVDESSMTMCPRAKCVLFLFAVPWWLLWCHLITFVKTMWAVIPPRGCSLWCQRALPAGAFPHVLLKITFSFLDYKSYAVENLENIESHKRKKQKLTWKLTCPEKASLSFWFASPFFPGFLWCVKFHFSNEAAHFIVLLAFHATCPVNVLKEKTKRNKTNRTGGQITWFLQEEKKYLIILLEVFSWVNRHLGNMVSFDF